jgi:hypothetical protein
MNLVPSKLGADPKKIVVLAGLVAIAGYFYFSNSNFGGGSGSAPVAGRAPAAVSSTSAPRAAARSSFRNAQQAAGSAREFRPSLKPKNIDTANIDPTLRLDLLAKLKNVGVEAGTRSLFEIAAAPPPEVKVGKEPEKIAIAHPFVGPQLPKAAEPPPEPKAPPIPLKFYGFVNKTKVGDKRAFFLDGEEIVIAGEGDMIKKRYKIVRIGVNSAVVEDTEFKSNNQQTLPLEAELAG